MSLNGYSWVEGNVPNAADPSGMIYELPSFWDTCTTSFGISLPLMILPQFVQFAEGAGTCISECGRRYIARAAYLEGKDVSDGAIVGIALAQINRYRKDGWFYSFKSIADNLKVADTDDNYTLYVNTLWPRK
jgi:hypothetical protein